MRIDNLLQAQCIILMGNDILSHLRSDKQYIQHKKISLAIHPNKNNVDNIERVFGKVQEAVLHKNKTAPNFFVRSITEQQQSSVEEQINSPTITKHQQSQQERISSPTAQYTKAQTSINLPQEDETFKQIEEQIKNSIVNYNNQNFNSIKYSPVKGEKINKENSPINKTQQRNRQHYFRLKGCQQPPVLQIHNIRT